MDDEYYSVRDLRGYADAIRNDAISTYDSTDKNDLDDFITLNQIVGLIDANSLGVDENHDYIIDQETHFDIVDQVSNWIFNVGLAKLAASNKLECAWDNSINEMIFWLPDNCNNGESNNDVRPNNSSETRNR